jgi:hypothetical protein
LRPLASEYLPYSWIPPKKIHSWPINSVGLCSEHSAVFSVRDQQTFCKRPDSKCFKLCWQLLNSACHFSRKAVIDRKAAIDNAQMNECTKIGGRPDSGGRLTLQIPVLSHVTPPCKLVGRHPK